MKEITLFEYEKSLGYISLFTIWYGKNGYKSRCLFYFQWKGKLYIDLLFIHFKKNYDCVKVKQKCLNDDCSDCKSHKYFSTGFPNTFLFFKIGWKNLGRVNSYYDSKKDVYYIDNHSYCHTCLHIGRDETGLFRYCPRCKIKIKD